MKRPFGFFLLAAFAAMLASLVVYGTLKEREAEVQRAMVQSVELVVAAQDLPLGTKIDAASVKLVRWSRDSVPAGSFENANAVIGTIVKNSFERNEPIVASKLFTGAKTAGVMPLLIPAGMRAMSVAVDEVSDIAGFVLPHSRVDVLVSVSSGGGPEGAAPFSKAVLQNVEVLAVAQQMEGTKETPQVVKVVTLLVSLEEAERLAMASHQGTLRLVLRSYNDDKIVMTRGVDISDMLRAYSNREISAPTITSQAGLHHAAHIGRPTDHVEILRNGKTSESLSFIDLSMNVPSSTARRLPARSRRPKVSMRSDRTAVAAKHDSPAPTRNEENASAAATGGSSGPAIPARVGASTEEAGASQPPAHPASTSGLMPHSRTIDIP